MDNRESGLRQELDFWRDQIFAPTGSFASEMLDRIHPEKRAFSWEFIKIIPAPRGSVVKILDVGAGPATIIGTICPKFKIEVTAIDPLAYEYDKLWEERKLAPTIRTLFGEAEQLLRQFGPDCFDLGFCRNAIDHAIDPIVGIRNCLAVTKPHCHVLMNHCINEAEAEGYRGLHQWNLTAQEARFIIWNRKATFDVATTTSDLCDDIRIEIPQPRWLVTTLRRKAV